MDKSKRDGRRAGPEGAMGEEACSLNYAGRLSGRQLSATVLAVQEVPHHRLQRLRHNHQPRKQRLLPTLNWQMSVTPSSRSRTPEHPADDPLRSAISPLEDPPPSSLGSTFTRPQELFLSFSIFWNICFVFIFYLFYLFIYIYLFYFLFIYLFYLLFIYLFYLFTYFIYHLFTYFIYTFLTLIILFLVTFSIVNPQGKIDCFQNFLVGNLARLTMGPNLGRYWTKLGPISGQSLISNWVGPILTAAVPNMGPTLAQPWQTSFR